MHEPTPMAREAAIAQIPDTPTTVEFRSIALGPGARLFRSAGGLIVIDPNELLVGAMGTVQADHVARLYRGDMHECELLADRTAYDVLRHEYTFARATIWLLDEPWTLDVPRIPGLTVRPLAETDCLDQVPDQKRREIDRFRQVTEVLAGFVEGTAVCFACAPSQSEVFADISIDTLEGFRRRGFARALSARLIDDLLAAGKTPVWGALVSNAASLALAASLGFTRPTGELFVCESPERAGAR